jgi:hypothetical protein
MNSERRELMRKIWISIFILLFFQGIGRADRTIDALTAGVAIINNAVEIDKKINLLHEVVVDLKAYSITTTGPKKKYQAEYISDKLAFIVMSLRYENELLYVTSYVDNEYYIKYCKRRLNNFKAGLLLINPEIAKLRRLIKGSKENRYLHQKLTRVDDEIKQIISIFSTSMNILDNM